MERATLSAPSLDRRDRALNRSRLMREIGDVAPALLSRGGGGGDAREKAPPLLSRGGGEPGAARGDEPDVYCHAGVKRMASALLGEIAPHVRAVPPTAELRLIGHSFGGSVLTLARAMLANGELALTPAAAAARAAPRVTLFSFGCVPVVKFRFAEDAFAAAVDALASGEDEAPPPAFVMGVDMSDAQAAATEAHLGRIGLGAGDVHDFALPWDPIPRMLTRADPWGDFMRSSPRLLKQIDQRASVFTPLFRGGWLGDESGAAADVDARLGDVGAADAERTAAAADAERRGPD